MCIRDILSSVCCYRLGMYKDESACVCVSPNRLNQVKSTPMEATSISPHTLLEKHYAEIAKRTLAALSFNRSCSLVSETPQIKTVLPQLPRYLPPKPGSIRRNAICYPVWQRLVNGGSSEYQVLARPHILQTSSKIYNRWFCTSVFAGHCSRTIFLKINFYFAKR